MRGNISTLVIIKLITIINIMTWVWLIHGGKAVINFKIQEVKMRNEGVEKIIDELNQQTGKNFRKLPANLKFIIARLDEGYTTEELISVITMKVSEWKDDPKMFRYLRPATLFNATKFNQYVGEIGVPTPENKENETHQRSHAKRFSDKLDEIAKKAAARGDAI